ncbi:MAG TPA: hypothetical protein VHV77_10675 [Pirellulales bacterium]|jgi:hypothetical protein|nr:hypothetical protein [Pirellulales bacterium]
MKHIDFLPPKYHEAAALRKTKAWRFLVLMTFGGLVCAAHIGQRAIRRNVQTQFHAVDEQYQTTQALSQRLAALQNTLAVESAKADLVTWLRNPWPRTQILARVFESLPDTIVLRRVRVQCEAVRPTLASATTVGSPVPAVDPAAEARLTPVQRDLKRLREEGDASQTVVLLEGTSDDDTALHVYLGTVAACGLFTKAELTSLESSDHGSGQQRAQFTARVLVIPGYGQHGGPTSAPDSVPIDLQATSSTRGDELP